MKTITITVSEAIYEEFSAYARKLDRKASELIRDAMEQYRKQFVQQRRSLRKRRPASVGGPIQPLTAFDSERRPF
jgi:metal-responsive CopG/Arc/MetJ family transcriptional regulator